MILNDSELLELLPTLSANQREALLIQSQELAESYLGANRSFQISKITDIKALSISNNIFITSLTPLIISEEQPLEIYLRKNLSNDWQLVDNSSITIDLENGEIVLNNLNEFIDCWSSSYNAPRSSINHFRNRQDRNNRVVAKVVYYSGWDFQEPLSRDAKIIKSILSDLITLKASSQYQENVKRFKLDSHYEVEYQTENVSGSRNVSGKVNSKTDELLALLKKYQPRNTSF